MEMVEGVLFSFGSFYLDERRRGAQIVAEHKYTHKHTYTLFSSLLGRNIFLKPKFLEERRDRGVSSLCL